MLRRRGNAGPRSATGQGSMRSIPKTRLHEVCWGEKSLVSHQKYRCGEERAIPASSRAARVFRAALISVALTAPSIITGLPTSDFGGILALNTRQGVGPPGSSGVPQLTSFLEATFDSEPSLATEDAGVVADNEETTGAFEAIQPPLMGSRSPPTDSFDVTLSPGLIGFRGPDEVVPFLLPMRPVTPRLSALYTSESVPAPDGDFADYVPSPIAEGPVSPAFYGPQSDELQVDDCRHFDAFLVSPLPSSVASRYKEFVEKEAAQADNMPYLHHIHGQTAVNAVDGEANPRLVVEGGQVTPLWSEDTDETPIFLMEEGTVTLIRLVAPVKSAYDAVASMMLMPIVNVDIAYGDGLLLSYRVSGDEGRQVNHQHVDGMHRPVAELDVVYKSCFSVGAEASEPIPVRAELRFGGCEPVVLMWRVICSKSALLQDVPSGFHLALGPATPAAKQDGLNVVQSAADGLRDPSRVPFPTVSDLRALASKQGDLVANGLPSQQVSLVQTASMVFDPSQEFVEMYAWCRECETGRLDMQVPTIASDLEVMFPLLYNFVADGPQQKSRTDGIPSLVASRPSSHIILRESIPGAEGNMHRFILQFQCKSEGESIVALDFPFHAYRDVQIFLKKQCLAPASAGLRDPSCSSGILSEDGTGCCLASCGTCGGDGCEDREGPEDSLCDSTGGLVGCCLTHIQSSSLPCDVATAPCVMTAQSASSRHELGSSMALPEEASVPRFRVLLAPLWLMSMALKLLKIFFYCLAVAVILVYLFAVCYGVQVLKEPVPVAVAPSTSQLLNAVFLLAGHLRHLYRTRGGSMFDSGGFHSYVPFEERGHSNSRSMPCKESPSCPGRRWVTDDTGASFIRLTSFKEKAAPDQNDDSPERRRPMEFCDIEADASAFSGRDTGNEDDLWSAPQGDFQAERWGDGMTGLLIGSSEHNPAEAAQVDDPRPAPTESTRQRFTH